MKKRYRVIFSSRKDFEQTMFLLKYLLLLSIFIIAVFIALLPASQP